MSMDDDGFEELRRRLRGTKRPPVGGGRGDGDGVDDGGDDDDDEEAGIALRHLALGAGAAVALALAVVVLSAARPAGEAAAPPLPRLAADDPASASSTTVTAVSVTTTTTAARLWPDEPVEVVGTEVRRGGHRWSVGRPGDLVAVGDWDCDGTPTPAVLRPSTSRLWIFDGWSLPDADLIATPGPAVPAAATAIEATACGRATVRTAAGEAHEIAVGP